MATTTYYHYEYEVEELGERINAHVTYGSNKGEQSATRFIRSDLEETFPDGAILNLELTAITDEKGRRM